MHPPPTPGELCLAYRHLLQHGLRAVRYSRPARFVVRDRLRLAFRSPTSTYDADRTARTLEFLRGAADSAGGIEHRILKGWVHVWWERGRLGKGGGRSDLYPLRSKAYEDFDRTIDMLNESMGLCIK
ncbi:hypothetical protein M433DRAFT_64647 [Acidomyces richmondensis BFW]|nr:MAG: hypothetical protein FE78DRAFT_142797 [Acidomyces sp. 'richmondensis']KYG46690.1 hypothetical protein M433DRAFT_64647 [Acidomyces richmondensis BFW]